MILVQRGCPNARDRNVERRVGAKGKRRTTFAGLRPYTFALGRITSYREDQLKFKVIGWDDFESHWYFLAGANIAEEDLLDNLKLVERASP